MNQRQQNTTQTATEIVAAGFITQDREGYAIASFGETEEEAHAAALACLGPWEERDGNTVGPDDAKHGFAAHYMTLPATANLIAEIQSKGGAIAWGNVEGIACTCAEEERHRTTASTEPKT